MEQILEESWNARTREAAERILVAAQRLVPDGASTGAANRPPPPAGGPGHGGPDAAPAGMLRAGQQRAPPHPRPDPVHGGRRPCSGSPPSWSSTAARAWPGAPSPWRCTPVTLGNRAWALLTLELAGRPGRLGGGLPGARLAPGHGARIPGHPGDEPRRRAGFLWPRIFLPCQSREADPASRCLEGRSVWVIDRDPVVRDALCGLVRGAGGEVQAHAGAAAASWRAPGATPCRTSWCWSAPAPGAVPGPAAARWREAGSRRS